jgi:hypothetical protein
MSVIRVCLLKASIGHMQAFRAKSNVCGAQLRFFTWVGSGLTLKSLTWLERLARDKHSSLLQAFLNYGHKKFSNIDNRNPFYEEFLKRYENDPGVEAVEFNIAPEQTLVTML